MTQLDIEDDTSLGRNAKNESRVAGIAADRLRSIVERIERLEEDKRGLSQDIADIMCEAKGAGLLPKAIRAVLKLRKMDAGDRDEEDTMIALYRRALEL